MIQVVLGYPVPNIFQGFSIKILCTHTSKTFPAEPLGTFSRAALRKTARAYKWFIPSPFLIRHLTRER